MDAAFDASGHLFELLEGPQVIFYTNIEIK